MYLLTWKQQYKTCKCIIFQYSPWACQHTWSNIVQFLYSCRKHVSNQATICTCTTFFCSWTLKIPFS